jgi:SAM-dependent methyltransferase
MDGFDELFGQDYRWFWAEKLPEERSDREAELIWELLGLERGVELLDLGCGHGRIANRLAGRGARVTGLDRSEAFLEEARADARRREVEVEYVAGDMRALPWQGRFDVVVNWFTAFGYHADGELQGILRGVHDALRPGGRLALETISVTALMRRFRPEGVTERDGDFLIERRRYDPLRGGVVSRYTVLRGGTVRRYETFLRMPTFSELREWLLDTGFRRVDGFGEDGDPLRDEHHRVIAVART